jgi:hypothetical protein
MLTASIPIEEGEVGRTASFGVVTFDLNLSCSQGKGSAIPDIIETSYFITASSEIDPPKVVD